MFSSLAVGLLDKCYKENAELTNFLLINELVYWSHWTCLSLAACGNIKEFLSHTSCQFLITDLWTGGMKFRKYLSIEVIFGILFPPALFTIGFRSAKEFHLMPQTKERYKENVKIMENINAAKSLKQKRNVFNFMLNLNHPLFYF